MKQTSNKGSIYDASTYTMQTPESYEDMTWMIYAVIGVAVVHLSDDGSKKMDQG